MIDAIHPRINFEIVSRRDSPALCATGMGGVAKQDRRVCAIDPFEIGVSHAEIIDRLRQELVVDLFWVEPTRIPRKVRW